MWWPPPTVGYLQAQEQASTANPSRPLALDCAGHHLEALATSAVGRSPRHVCALAAPAVPGYWAELSNTCGKLGRPPTGKEIRELIQTMARANPLWRAPRIHGELLKLGIEVSERTVSRVLQTVERPPSQTWKTFLKNHVGEIVATDFFTVPTIRLRVVFVFLVLEHERRKVLHFGVTEHPSAQWVAHRWSRPSPIGMLPGT
jgi:hypothetical protein